MLSVTLSGGGGTADVTINNSLLCDVGLACGIRATHFEDFARLLTDHASITIDDLVAVVQAELQRDSQLYPSIDAIVKHFKALLLLNVLHRPLVVLIGGAPKSGKSTMANLLARLFGIPAIFNTDVLLEVLQMFEQVDCDLTSPDSKENAFLRQCSKLQPHILQQIEARIQQRKSAVFEGAHLLPQLFQEVSKNSSAPITCLILQSEANFQDLLCERSSRCADEAEREIKELWEFSTDGASFHIIDNSPSHPIEESIEAARVAILEEVTRSV